MDGNKTILQQEKTSVTGRVEVEYKNHWGTICSDGFGNDDALVLCAMMNYSFGYEVFKKTVVRFEYV